MITFPPNDPPAESYQNTRANPPCENLRWWVGSHRIMGGGSVVDSADWDHLRSLGITHVLNLDSKTDAGIVPAESLCEVTILDNGMAIAAPLLAQCCDFARTVLASPGAALYVHSGNGGARAPAIVYAVLRSVLGMSHEDGLVTLNKAYPHGTGFHWGYLDGHRCAVGSIDLAIDEGSI
jgi:hypothetical protein